VRIRFENIRYIQERREVAHVMLNFLCYTDVKKCFSKCFFKLHLKPVNNFDGGTCLKGTSWKTEERGGASLPNSNRCPVLSSKTVI
jgi:hypothetical protein